MLQKSVTAMITMKAYRTDDLRPAYINREGFAAEVYAVDDNLDLPHLSWSWTNSINRPNQTWTSLCP